MKKKICIIEDNPLFGITLKNFIVSAFPFAEVYLFSLGKNFLHYLESSPPPFLTFLDLHLPDVSGIEVLKKLTEKKSKIIVITGYADPKLEIKLLQIPEVLSYLVKPIELKEIKKIILQILKNNIEANRASPLEVLQYLLLLKTCYGIILKNYNPVGSFVVENKILKYFEFKNKQKKEALHSFFEENNNLGIKILKEEISIKKENLSLSLEEILRTLRISFDSQQKKEIVLKDWIKNFPHYLNDIKDINNFFIFNLKKNTFVTESKILNNLRISLENILQKILEFSEFKTIGKPNWWLIETTKNFKIGMLYISSEETILGMVFTEKVTLGMSILLLKEFQQKIETPS